MDHPDINRAISGGSLWLRLPREGAARRVLANQERLREVVRGHGDEVTAPNAHDPGQLRAAQRTGEAVS
jgi:hypothetical protein